MTPPLCFTLGVMAPSTPEDAQRGLELTYQESCAEADPDDGVPQEVRFEDPTYPGHRPLPEGRLASPGYYAVIAAGAAVPRSSAITP